MNNWKEQLNEEFPVRDSRTEEFITEIIEKLIEDIPTELPRDNMSCDFHSHLGNLKQQLRNKWL